MHRTREDGITVGHSRPPTRPGRSSDSHKPQSERPRRWSRCRQPSKLADQCTVHSLLQSETRHTSKQINVRGSGDRVLCSPMAFHAHPTASTTTTSCQTKHIQHHSAAGGRQPLEQRADGRFLSAAKAEGTRGRSKARERAILRLPWPSWVQGAAYLSYTHRYVAMRRLLASAGS